MALDLQGLTQDQQFAKAAEAAGVPESVLRGMWRTESSEGKDKLSPAGAEGDFQIMPATRKTWEDRTGRTYNPMDFADSLTLAALTLGENMQATKGNVADALRMYNAGPDRSKWDNPETRAYAGKVLGDNFDLSSLDVTTHDADAPTMDELWNTSAYDMSQRTDQLASGAVRGEHLTAYERGVVDAAGLAAAVAAQVSGTDDPQAAALEARQNIDPLKAIESTTANMTEAPSLDYDDSRAFEQQLATEQALVDKQTELEQYTGWDKFKAAFDSNTITAQIVHLFTDEHGFGEQEGFDVLHGKTADSIFSFARNADEIREQNEAVSEAHLASIRKTILRRRHNEEVIAADSSAAAQMGWNLLAGVADPVGWLAGLGTGKMFQMAGMGARVAFKAGKIAKGYALAATEGAVGNLATTAAIDAAGGHVTSHDYAFAAGTGLLFGATFGSFEHAGGAKERAKEEMIQIAERDRENAVKYHKSLLDEATANLGPNADAQALGKEAARIDAERQKRVMEGVLGPAHDHEQILPKLDPEQVAEFKANWKGEMNELPKFLPGAVLNSRAAIEATAEKYKLDLTIADSAERALAAEMYARAERFMAANPVDKVRASKLLEAAGLESTAQRMLLSDNPLMQMTASVLLESSSGMGGRRATAAMTAKLRERIYVHNVLNEYETLASNFRKQRGVNRVSEFMSDSKVRKEFDKAVYEYRDRRLNGYHDAVSNPNVQKAADLLDAAYERMRVEQKYIGTMGSSRLADEVIRGYQPRRWAYGKIRGMNGARYAAFIDAIADQMKTTAGFDEKFAKKFAVEYAGMARQKAAGSYDVPMNLHSDEAADMVRDALKAAGATDMEADSLMGRFSRGGAGHTKKRIDMDMTRRYKDADGAEFTLMDFADTDNMNLVRNYARRAAGEVALAKFGIMGEQGLKELRHALQAGMEKNKVHDSELEAFDQIASEFLGKPVGNATPLGKWSDNLRIFASSVKLGGMGFTQLGETANAFAALGTEHALRGVKSLPRALKEARALARGERVENSILNSIELYTGELGVDGYRMQGLYDVNDGFELYGKETLDRASKAIRAGNHAVRVMSGHRAVMSAQVRGLSEQIALKALRFIRDGGEDAALKDMGFTPELVTAIKREMKARVKADGTRVEGIAKFGPDGHVTHLDLTRAKDQAAANLFAQAVQRGAAQIIQETFIGETGKWAHNGLLKMLLQFRTFSLISVEKQWNRQVGVHGLTKAIGYTLGAMSLALPIHMARVAAKAQLLDGTERDEYLDRNLSPVALGRATMNYASTLGVLPDMLDAGMAVVGKGGYAYGGRGTGNSQNRLIGDSIAPAVGVVNDLGKLATQHDAHTLARLLPGASIPMFQAGVGLMGEAAEEMSK